jgi:hypothetical protein
MSKRRKSPRRVYVPKYARWKNGNRERVGEHHRGEDHKLSVRKSAKQMRLDPGDDEKPKR